MNTRPSCFSRNCEQARDDVIVDDVSVDDVTFDDVTVDDVTVDDVTVVSRMPSYISQCEFYKTPCSGETI